MENNEILEDVDLLNNDVEVEDLPEVQLPPVEILGPPVGFTDILYDHLLEKSKAEMDQVRTQGSNRNPLRPSSAGKCTRELAFELMENSGQKFYEKEPLDAVTQLIFGLGHSVEFHILREFKNVEMLRVAYQQQSLLFFPIEASNPRIKTFIEGSVDALFIMEKQGYKVLIDVKSKKEKFSNSHKSSWEEFDYDLSGMSTVTPISETAYWIEDVEAFLTALNDPFMAANFLQLNLYARSEFMLQKGVDCAALIYYSKNTSRLRELRFKPSQKLYDGVREKFQAAASAADVGNPMLAKTDYTPNSMKCAFCSYAKECWPEELSVLKNWFKTLPAKRWPKDLKDLPEDFEKDVRAYHEGLPVLDAQEELKERIIKYMYENKLQKIQLERGGPVYELKVFKNSMNLIRSKA